MNPDTKYYGPNTADYMSAFAKVVTPFEFSRLVRSTLAEALAGDPLARNWISTLIFDNPLPTYHGTPMTAEAAWSVLAQMSPSEHERFDKIGLSALARRQERGETESDEDDTEEMRPPLDPHENHPETQFATATTEQVL